MCVCVLKKLAEKGQIQLKKRKKVTREDDVVIADSIWVVVLLLKYIEIVGIREMHARCLIECMREAWVLSTC